MRDVAEIARARDGGREWWCTMVRDSTRWAQVWSAGVDKVCGLVTKDCWLWSRKSRNRGMSRCVVGLGKLRERSGVLGWQAAGA
jgi:hypothetical protein